MLVWIPREMRHLDTRQSMQLVERRLLLADGLLRVRWRRLWAWQSSGNRYGWFWPDGSQDAILVPWFAPPHPAISTAEVMSTLISIIAYPPETFRESVFILGNVTQSGHA